MNAKNKTLIHHLHSRVMHFTCIFSYFPLHFLLIFYLIKTFFCTCTLLFESIFDLSKKNSVLSDMFYEQLFKKLLFIIYWNEVWKKTSICSVWWIFHDTTEFFNWIFFSVMADWSQLNTVPPSPAFALLSISTWYRKTLQSLKSFFWVKVLDLHKATVNDIHNIINSYTKKNKKQWNQWQGLSSQYHE